MCPPREWWVSCCPSAGLKSAQLMGGLVIASRTDQIVRQSTDNNGIRFISYPPRFDTRNPISQAVRLWKLAKQGRRQFHVHARGQHSLTKHDSDCFGHEATDEDRRGPCEISFYKSRLDSRLAVLDPANIFRDAPKENKPKSFPPRVRSQGDTPA